MTLNSNPGNVYWITGLAGSGKTTLGKALYSALKQQNNATVLLDGDTLREVLGGTPDYRLEARKEKAYLYSRLCGLLAGQGIDVICCTISMFHDVRKRNREQLEQYIEVFIDADMDILKLRDQKGLYTSENDGDVMGLGLKAEFPTAPDITFRIQSPEPDLQNMVQKIIERSR